MIHIFVAGISIALFLIAIILTKPTKHTPDYILLVLLFFSAQTIFNTFWVFTNSHLLYPDALVIGLNAPIAVAPLFYLYTKYQIHPIRFRPLDLLHLALYFIFFLLYVKFYFLSYEEKLVLMNSKGGSNSTLEISRTIITYVSGFFYFLWSLWILLQFRKNMKHQFSNTEKIRFNWLIFLIVGMLFIWLVVLIIQDDSITSVSSTLFLILLGYFGITQVNVFSGVNNNFLTTVTQSYETSAPIKIEDGEAVYVKYKNSILSEEEATKIHQQLKQLLHTERHYLNPELTLSQLAQCLKVHPNKLSEVINTQEQKSFYDLINELRVREFLLQVVKSENSRFTFTSLAYDCGFNSKASFNRNFKKHIGITPSEYLNKQN